MEAVARKTRMGFNLIEAAIVLAVVGGVIGAIWVAAANMYESHKVNKTVEGIFSTARNIQNLISIRDAEALGDIYIDSLLIDAEMVPKDWVSGGILKSPLGERIQVVTSYNAGAGARFGFRVSDIKESECVKMITKLSSFSAASNAYGVIQSNIATGSNLGSLLRISLNSSSPFKTFDHFPVTPEAAVPHCARDDLTSISVTFAYTRINN